MNRNFPRVALCVVLSFVVQTAFAQSKTVAMKPLTITRGDTKFGPLNGAAKVLCKSANATVTVDYSIDVQNQGRVSERADKKGETNGPVLNLELLDKDGKLVARSDRFLAPTWACNVVTKGSKEVHVSLFNSVCARIESFRLVPTGDTWREEACQQ